MYLAIDLGGTKTLIGLFDESGAVKDSVKFPTPADYSQFLIELRQNIENLVGGNNIIAGCMAIPGTLDREKGLILHLGNLPWDQNIEIKKDVEEFLNFPITIENDANLAGLSEATLVKDSYKKVLYVTISTGIGGGFIVDGVIDKDTINAEIGHMVFEHDGKVTDWEDMASGKWIVETYGKRASELDDESAWKTISQNIAVGFVNLINILTPDIIIIGGGVGTHLDKFKAILGEEINKINPNFAQIPPIVKAQRPEEAVIYGCYELIKE